MVDLTVSVGMEEDGRRRIPGRGSASRLHLLHLVDKRLTLIARLIMHRHQADVTDRS